MKNPENNPWIPNHPEDNPWILGGSSGFMIHGIYFQDSWGDPGGCVDLMRLENRNGEHVNLGLGKQAESGCTWFILLFYGCFRPWVYLVYLLLRCVLPFSPSLGSFLWSCLPVLPKMMYSPKLTSNSIKNDDIVFPIFTCHQDIPWYSHDSMKSR